MIAAKRKRRGDPRGLRSDESSDSTTNLRRRGRPARLSRDFVVDAALAMLAREPHEGLTIARIAREVEAVPAALYRHFESFDDILDSVLARVLATNEPSLDEGASWQSQLAGWMRGLRMHLLQYPAVIPLIGRSGRTSPAWLETSSTLVEILEAAGLSGRDLAATYLWILEMTVGLVMQEAVMPLPEQLASARASHYELSERARTRFAPILAEMQRLDGDALFEFVVERVTTIVASGSQVSPRI